MSSVTGESRSGYRIAGDSFDSGGQSTLFRCTDSDGRARVYKRYLVPVTDVRVIEWIRGAVARGSGIVSAAEESGRVAETAHNSINWPIDLVVEGDAVAGVILPMIPDEFMDKSKPRTIDHLYVASAAPPPAEFRVGVLIRVCDILVALDEFSLIHGDVSPKNLVWRRDTPHAYLIDCDGLRPVGVDATHGVGTQGWIDPRWTTSRIPAHDQYSDRFGLAVLMYRGLLLNPGAPALVAGTWHRPSGLPDDLPNRLRDLFSRAFDDPYAAADRPSAAQWREGLAGVFLTADANSYRTEALAVLDRHAKAIGETEATTQGVSGATSFPGARRATAPKPGAPKSGAAKLGVPKPTAPKAKNGQQQAQQIAAFVVIAIIVIVVVLIIHSNSQHQAGPSPTTDFTTEPYTYSYTPEITVPTMTIPPPVAVGDCVSVSPSGIPGAPGRCSNSGWPYQVTSVSREGGDCPSSENAKTYSGGYLICLRRNYLLNYCYYLPDNGWISGVDCPTAGSYQVRAILRGIVGNSNTCARWYDSSASANQYLSVSDPPETVCISRY